MLQRTSMFKHLPLLLLLTGALVVGTLTVRDFGESWDEADIRSYSVYAREAYSYLGHPRDLEPFQTNLNLYGPGYFMVAGAFADALRHVVPSWSMVNAWHAAYFLTFLACGVFLYALARRFMSDFAAIGATLLFFTQPLLWGHAFINPKDIPFMAFFTATVCTGLWMVDRLAQPTPAYAAILPAGILMGFTGSLRIVGPMAGLLVLGYSAYRLRFRAWLPGMIYLVIAMLTGFLCWPYLWAAPWPRLVESFTTMAEFPFRTAILFAGEIYKADTLPMTYFPAMLALQLSEPALLLIVSGLVIAIVSAMKRRGTGPLALFLAWFFIPAAYIVLRRSPLYDNARQLFFLLPPIFILAGLTFDWLFQRLTHKLAQTFILLLAVLPGILISARLHPYEYVYYNALVGGTGGAFRHYEMDYWGTSFDEITRYMNSAATPDARVLVYGPEQIVAASARPDVQVFIPEEGSDPGYDYVILLNRANADERLCRKADTIYEVGRRGAIFAELRGIPPGVDCR